MRTLKRVFRTLLASAVTLIPVAALAYGLLEHFEETLVVLVAIGVALTVLGTTWRWWNAFGSGFK